MTDLFDTPPATGPKLEQVDPPPSFLRPALYALIAVAFVALCIAAYIRFENKTPTATGEIARIAIYPVQARIYGAAAGMPGMAGQDEVVDQLLVFAHVRLRNQNAMALKIEDDWAVITLPNGETRRSLGANSSDFDKVFLAYPQLAPLRMDPLRRDTQIQPGETVDGLVVFSYPLSRKQWDTRKSMQVTVAFTNAKDVTLNGPPG